MRTEFDPVTISTGRCYRLLTSIVVPRPIAWVSTLSEDGVANLAPHSFFTVSCVDPPVIQFTSVGVKDSLRNVRATGEFVVCLTPEPLFEQINATGTAFPPDVDEFAAVGLTPEPSARVAPARVGESPVAIECTLRDAIELGDSTVVLGDVVHIAVDSDTFDGDPQGRGLPAIESLRPLARLGGDEWSTIGEVRALSRIALDDWPGHYGSTR